MNYHFLYTDRLPAQLKWSRFINTIGQPGCNIPCDLHMEHLNRQLKGSLRNLRSNIETGPITRAGKAVGVVNSVGTQFSKELDISKHCGRHHTPIFHKDSDLILPLLRQTNPLVQHPSRKISSLKLKSPLLDTMDKDEKLVKRKLHY